MPGQAYRALLAPQADAYYKSLENHPKLHEMTVDETRSGEAEAAAAFQQPDNICKIEDISVPGKASEVPVRIFTPSGPGPFPLILHFHGGGFYCGSLDECKQLAAHYASFCGAVCCSVGYRLCPEHPFPAGVDDSWAALMWATHPHQAARLNVDRTKVAVAGESAGGNLAAVLAIKARQEGLRVIQAQVLVCACLDLTGLNYPSHKEFSDELYCSSLFRRRYHGWYMPGLSQQQKENPLLSPLCVSDLSHLPPAFVLTAEVDGLRDEGVEYAQRLEAAGNKVQAKTYKGHFHCSMLYVDVFKAEAEQAFLEVKAFLYRVWDLPLL